MSQQMKVWAVDISWYSLWTSSSKGEALVESFLASSTEEQAKVKRYLREFDQIRSLAGKLLVRVVLSELVSGVHWNDWQFQTTKEGRPYLKSPMIDFDFNITHDGDWVAIAFRGTLQPQHQPVAPSIGVDVMEIHLPRFENTVQDFVSTMDMTLTSRERQWVLKEYTTDTFKTKISPPNSLSNHEFDQLKKLYTLWTYKEAFTKAKGMGLGFDFQTIDIEKEANSIAIKAGGQLQKGWKIYEMVLTPGKSANRRVGGGTGMESLLVVVEDTKEDDPVSLKTIDMEQAQQEGLLRIWTMENLVKASKQLIDKR